MNHVADMEALRVALARSEGRADAAEAQAAQFAEAASEAEAEIARLAETVSNSEAIIVSLRLMIEKLRRELYGRRSERKVRLLNQLELELEDLEAGATEDALATEQSAPSDKAPPAPRRVPSRKPFAAHLPRERVMIPPPESCSRCGSDRLVHLGEDVTETLEVVPRHFKVVQTVREKVSCRECETIHQAPAPWHATPRGWAGPNLLATILYEKYGQHQPLNRQCERYRREGVDVSVSTLADQVGACSVALRPLRDLIAAHMLGAARVHGDDTTVPVLARGKTATGRIWVYVRDDQPFGGTDPPAALFEYSRNRSGVHPERHLYGYGGILQADAYAGYNRLTRAGREPGPVTLALCWAHARRRFFVLADVAGKARPSRQSAVIAPLALEAVRRMDALFEIEREISGLDAEARLAARLERSAPLVEDLKQWMRDRRPGLSRNAQVAKAMDYMLTRWPDFARFLEDGRICLTNNAAERALRGIALGRKSWLFAGSDRGGERAAMIYTLIVTAKLNQIDPQAWLADVLARIAAHPNQRLDELLPWNWQPARADDTAA